MQRQASAELDTIIVGAGSAGSVLANRLSADAGRRVLILEAGPVDRFLYIHIPAGYYSVWNDPRINWDYYSEPQEHLKGRRIYIPRGKVLGGSSSINSMVYMRGHPKDYDGWARDFGLATWDYAHCLPYFKRSERSDRGESQWRGGSGPLLVTGGILDNPLFDAFLEAGRQQGVGVSQDLNGFEPNGLARYDSTKGNGRRCSAAVAYLRPALARANLRLETGAHVLRILVEKGRAVGVEYEQGGVRRTARAAREVILSGGAINSPQLLLLSGIGDPAHLKEIGIPVVEALPGVGRNLQDHLDVQLKWACTKPVSIDRYARPIPKAIAGLQWLATRTGFAASTIWEAGGIVRSSPDVPYGNLQYHFMPAGVSDRDPARPGSIRLMQAFQLHLSQMRQESRGRLTLASSDPKAKPRLAFDFMATDRDMRELIDGVRLTRDIIGQKAFDEFRGEELLPGPAVRTDAEIDDWVRSTAATEFHPSCTCRMGSDGMAVVDSELRVRGVEGLRVVDASVMPNVISANLNAPTMMIAERAADMILGKALLAPERVRFSFQQVMAE
jgi:choline dehydrogenase